MAWEVQQWVWRDRTIGGNDKFVALALANYAQKDGTRARPSVGTLADDTGLSRKTVGQRLANLVQIGYIEQTSHSGQHHAATYSFTFQMGSSFTPADPQMSKSGAQVRKSGRPDVTNLRTNQKNLFDEPATADPIPPDFWDRLPDDVRARRRAGRAK